MHVSYTGAELIIGDLTYVCIAINNYNHYNFFSKLKCGTYCACICQTFFEEISSTNGENPTLKYVR